MEIKINGNHVRIIGENGVSLDVYCSKDEKTKVEFFSSSLVFHGFEHGCLPLVEITSPDTIVISNSLPVGRFLYK